MPWNDHWFQLFKLFKEIFDILSPAINQEQQVLIAIMTDGIVDGVVVTFDAGYPCAGFEIENKEAVKQPMGADYKNLATVKFGWEFLVVDIGNKMIQVNTNFGLFILYRSRDNWPLVDNRKQFFMSMES